MSWAAKLAKLRKMSGAELSHRVAERARLVWRRAQCALGCRPWPALRTEGLHLNLFARAKRLVPGTQPAELAAWREFHPASYHAAASQALARSEEVLAGRLSFFGQSFPIPRSGSWDWHADPRTGHRWPRTFSGDLPLYELPQGVDVKYVWELNRLQALVHLAQAWRISGEARFAIRARELALDWIAQNPCYQGVNWTSALEPAMRVLAWLWSLAALADWSGWQRDDQSRILACLADHGHFLAEQGSHYSSPYNHLMGEATALYVLGRWLQGLPEAARWERLGRETLSSQAPLQFYEDGFSVEQSTSYHFYTLGFLLQAATVARQAGDSWPELDRTIRRAVPAALAYAQPDYSWPAVGDLDSARALPVLPENRWDFSGLMGLASAFLGEPASRLPGQQPGAELAWLLGSAGLAAWRRLPLRDLPAGHFLPQSGLVVSRFAGNDSAEWLAFDVGPLGAGLHADATPSVGHGHADTLQVLLYADGAPVWTDPGMRAYAGPLREVNAFRTAAAHNTVEIEGRPVARPTGRLAWSAVREPEERKALLTDSATFGHGSLDYGQGFRHERCVLHVFGQGVWIADLVAGPDPVVIRWNWNFPWAPEEEVPWLPGPTGGTLLGTLRRGRRRFQIHAPAGSWSDWQVTWDRNRTRAPGYGESRPGARLTVAATLTEPRLLLTSWTGRTWPLGVRVGNLSCCAGDVPTERWLAPPPGATLAWTLGQTAGWESFACGLAGGSLDASWQPVAGQGNWRVGRRFMPAEVSALCTRPRFLGRTTSVRAS